MSFFGGRGLHVYVHVACKPLDAGAYYNHKSTCADSAGISGDPAAAVVAVTSSVTQQQL